jgi:hypothetical protein
MTYNGILALGWVIGFASSTVLIIIIAIYQSYKKYTEEQKRKTQELNDRIVREQTQFKKWKWKVLRP